MMSPSTLKELSSWLEHLKYVHENQDKVNAAHPPSLPSHMTLDKEDEEYIFD